MNKNLFVQKLDLPKEIVSGCTLISLFNNDELLIENHKGLIDYNNSQIIIITDNNRIVVSGQALNIKEFSKDDILIKGQIIKLSFEDV